jgi:hypothetical protein
MLATTVDLADYYLLSLEDRLCLALAPERHVHSVTKNMTALAIVSSLLGASNLPASAQEKFPDQKMTGQKLPDRTMPDTNLPDPFYEIETKYIFGFTEGASIGLEGEKEFSTESIAGFGKQDGRYAASQTKLEFEHTPNQFIQVEFGALVSTHNIENVTGLSDQNAQNFSGMFGEFRYLLIGRGPSSPIGVTVSVEPLWRRVDETTGERVTNFELETKLHVDTELVQNRVYLGFNAFYEPEKTQSSMGDWTDESTLGLSTAVAFRLVPEFLLGAEAGYFRHYAGIGMNTFTGDAFYLGPTLYVQLARKIFMTAAWSNQIGGHAVDDPSSLNLVDFPRNRAKLKFAFEF